MMKKDFCAIVRQCWKAVRWWLPEMVVLCTWPLLDPAKCYIYCNPWFKIALVTIISGLVIHVCIRLTDYFSLLKKEVGITVCQMAIVIAVVGWGVSWLLIFNLKEKPNYAILLGIIGTLAGWIFQDTIKGVAAFFHLRWNKLLNIGDWIQVPNLNVDGEVTHITLTTVTICNWDTTTSSIPTSVLRSGHFVNLRNMTAGKTYGRLMMKTFILDTGWFFAITADDAERLKKKDEVKRYLPTDEIEEGATNAHLFRLYLYHWLMSNPQVSQQPRLVVRWLEQKEAGMPLQVYAFIMQGSMPAFEWQQSKIIEHILESLDWFGLRLFQTPSSFDVSNSNIYMAQSEAVYRKEIGK